MHGYASEKFGELVLGAAAFASLGAGRRGHEDVVADRQRLGECLVQTYCREDHRVRRHAGYFAREFDRTFVDDGQQYAEFCNFASTQSVNLFREHVKPCHRADVWRYLHMYRRGGVYLDFKCGLLQPLWRWLLELQNACVQHELGRQGRARAGAQCPPFMVTSLGTFKHVFQGLIICSPQCPLLARLLGEAMVTRRSELESKAKGQGYLAFCRQFYQTLKKGAQLNKLEPGWVDAGPYGWVYLLKEDKLVTDKALHVMQLTKPIPDTE